MPPTLWDAIKDLPLTIEGVRYGTLDPEGGERERAHGVRTVHLQGGGEEGQAEDITRFLAEAAPPLDLAGEFTVASFAAHLKALDQWPDGPPEWEMAVRWRNWAYESAGLDLALQQAGRPLHEVVGRDPQPVTYVNSLGLGEPPSTDTILARLEKYPSLRFKLDAEVSWTPEIIETLAGTGAVDIVDFKGRYGLEITDESQLPTLYERCLEAFPDALIEDPHDDRPEIVALVEPHAARISYDAPIATVDDLAAQRFSVRTFNVKPVRVGSLENLSALYATCEERGYRIYGGGMGELGVARGQIQLLASLFSAAGPNDIAPPGFNAPEPAAGLPPSPLDPAPAPQGFRRVVER